MWKVVPWCMFIACAALLAQADHKQCAAGERSLLQTAATTERSLPSTTTTLANSTVFAFVSTSKFASRKILRSALMSLATRGDFRGDVLVVTDKPKCVEKVLMQNRTAHRPEDETLPRVFSQFSLLGLLIHMIQVPPVDELIYTKALKAQVWEHARLAGLQPSQIIYQDADIIVGSPVQPFLAYLQGDQTSYPLTPKRLSFLEARVAKRERKGLPLLVYQHEILGGPDGKALVRPASAGVAARAAMLTFGSHFMGKDPRHGGFVVTRAGGGEACLAKWKEGMLKMHDVDHKVFEDQPALGVLDCTTEGGLEYLPWQFLMFPWTSTLLAGRVGVFMHFTNNFLLRQEDPRLKTVIHKFLSHGLGLDESEDPWAYIDCHE